MPEYVCNTSPLQYLHQLGRLQLLPELLRRVIVPEAVIAELEHGRRSGWDVPSILGLKWVEVREATSALSPGMISDLGPGEVGVLSLALGVPDAVVILDDRLGRQVALGLHLRLTGTLGLLLDFKKAGLIPAVTPLLDDLQRLRFRVSSRTRAAVLRLAGEM